MGIIDRQAIEKIAAGFQSKNLFYPCAGEDIVDPIVTFLPFIDKFWFVDLKRFKVRELLAEQEVEFLQHDRSTITGHYLRDKNESFRLRNDCFVCRHLPTDSQFTINYCYGPRSGYNAFRAVVKDPGNPLSVFYYRGDSLGEGGSGFRWTDRKMLRYVLAEIEPGGMLVTDGSNGHPRIRKFCYNDGRHLPHSLEEAKDIVNASPAFDYRSWHLECIAYLGHRYGPTLAWRVDRKNTDAAR